LYELYDKNTGAFLKHGMTQDMGGRYSASYLADKDMIETAVGPRSVIARMER